MQEFLEHIHMSRGALPMQAFQHQASQQCFMIQTLEASENSFLESRPLECYPKDPHGKTFTIKSVLNDPLKVPAASKTIENDPRRTENDKTWFEPRTQPKQRAKTAETHTQKTPKTQNLHHCFTRPQIFADLREVTRTFCSAQTDLFGIHSVSAPQLLPRSSQRRN